MAFCQISWVTIIHISTTDWWMQVVNLYYLEIHLLNVIKEQIFLKHFCKISVSSVSHFLK